MKQLLNRAVEAARNLWTTEPVRVTSGCVAAILFAAGQAHIVLNAGSVQDAVALILPVLLGGEVARRLVTPAAAASSDWLVTGKLPSWGLTFSRHQLEDAGTFTGGGRKILWHTTEGGTLDSVVQTLKAKRAAVHFAIDIKTGRVVQMIPLNRAGRGLEHNGGPETNRANAIQIEIVGFAAESGTWTRTQYQRLAALACLIEHRFDVPRHARGFHKPAKFTGDGFVAFAGHCGHVHVPGNSHVDPGTGFNWPLLLEQMRLVGH